MRKRIPIKNHQHEIQLISQRVMWGLIIICICMTLILVRLAFLQIHKHDMYTTLATKNWLDLVPIEPTRGLIYDRNKVLLAENIPVFSLDIIPMQVIDLKKTLAILGTLVELADSDISQFTKQLKQHRRFDEIPLKLRLSDEEVARVSENQYRLAGVTIRARLMRHYPFGESFSHVLGYVGRINAQELNEIDPINYSASHYIGKLGIEKYYEDELHGTVGYQEVENDASGRTIRVLKEIKGKPGKNIYLSLDSRLQFIAEKALGDHRGAIVAIQPESGQVLALVSKPTYDPNNFVIGISHQNFQSLQQSEDRPLFNRALRGLYPLASTIKPYVALKGLDTNVINVTDTVYDPGYFQIRNNSHRFHDWFRRGHGNINVIKAIASSCDTFFYSFGLKMGIRQIDTILTQFGFGALTGIDLEEELPGVVATPEWKLRAKGIRWYDGDTVISSIGQGSMLATPLQLASAVATLANRGQRFMPYLLMGEQAANEPYISQSPIPLESVPIQDSKNWEIVIKAMEDTIKIPQGTAYTNFGRNYKYTIAAKTGTAQVVSLRLGSHNEVGDQSSIPEKLRDHGLFIAFAPVDEPKLAIAIITENSHASVKIARIIFDYYLGTQQNVVNRTAPAASKKASA